jgi:DNA polymerase-3 subunit beta
MTLKIEVDILRNAINSLLTVVDKKQTRQILSYIHIKALPGQLHLEATDMEVASKIILQADVDNFGSFCVNAKNISDILREFPNQKVELNHVVEKNSLEIKSGNIFFSILVLDPKEYPQVHFDEVKNSFELDSSNLLDIIHKTSHAMSNDEARLYLNGIFFQQIDHQLRTVATDGYKLSLIDLDIDLQKNEALTNGVIVPKKGIYEFKKLCEENVGKRIKIFVNESYVFAMTTNQYISVRLIAKEYVRYQAVIPNKTTFSLAIDKNTFIDSVKRIKIMSNEKSNGIKVKLDTNQMIISANNPGLGDAEEKLIVNYSGKAMEIGFNARFLLDALAVLPSNEITLEINNELSPIVIKSANLPRYLGIIMPLKI